MFLLCRICDYAAAADLFIAYNHVVYKHIDTGSATALLRQKQDERGTRVPGRVGTNTARHLMSAGRQQKLGLWKQF